MSEDRAVSQAEFARIMGWAKSYVTALKKAGRLALDGAGRVLVEASKARIAATADPNRDDVRARHAEARGEGADADDSGEAGESAENHDYQRARAKKEHYLAEQARLEYERETGKLVEKSEVEAAVADVAATFRQALENLPHRAAADLVGKDLDAIRATLKQEVHSALAEMERAFTAQLAQMGSIE